VSADTAKLIAHLAGALEAVAIRAEDGDPRTDWRPTIARIARTALAAVEPPERSCPQFAGHAPHMWERGRCPGVAAVEPHEADS
jgi:hypothetical protein